MRKLTAGLALGFLVSSPAVLAAPVGFTSGGATGLEHLGSFDGSLDFDAFTGALSITLTNTSAAANGGFLTGFAFNVADGVSGVSLTSGGGFKGVANVSTSPFGTFDFGAALGGNWLGGGKPSGGIAAGATATFSFQLVGDYTNLTAADFLTGESDSSDYAFAARFRGFGDGGSDKVIGSIVTTQEPPEEPCTPDNPPPPHAPLPAAVWAGIVGAGMALAARRRRQQRRAHRR